MQPKSTATAIILALVSLTASAQSFSLNGYTVQNTYGLELSVGGVSGLEGSAITYAQDRGTLFYVGDEGKGVIEISRTGFALGSMQFSGWGEKSTKDGNDSEGLAYLGNGELVVAEERLQNAYKFSFAAGTSIDLGAMPYASVGSTIGNVGIEGISYDMRNGNFVTVKQDNPATLSIFSSLSFSTLAAPDAVANILFSGSSSLFGLSQLSDVQTLSILGNDNLLVLSTGTGALDSRELIEIKRDGTVMSRLDLTNIVPRNAIEGVTIDEHGTIYLIAEQDQLSGAAADSRTQLIVLSPVPEPETYTMMLVGLGLMGAIVRRKSTKAAV
jgi:uncharacterized protein YjiK